MSALSSLIYMVEVVVGIGFLIFIHEFGHFLMAKRAGVRVVTFNIGFGPVLIGFTRGDTMYNFRVLPLGGYVKMAGEHTFEDRTGADDELLSKGFWPRLWIYLGGVIMNAIVCFVFFYLAFVGGMQRMSPVLGEIRKGAPAEDAGLREGDKLLAINGLKTYSFEDLFLEVSLSDNKVLTLDIEREGKKQSIDVKPRTKADNRLLSEIGVEPPNSNTIGYVSQSSELAEQLKQKFPGYGNYSPKLEKVNGVAVSNWPEVQREVHSFHGANPDKKSVPILMAFINANTGAVTNVDLELRYKYRKFGIYFEEIDKQKEMFTNVIHGLAKDEDGSPLPGEAAGLMKGDKLLSINMIPIDPEMALSSVRKILNDSDSDLFLVEYEREGQPFAASVTAPWRVQMDEIVPVQDKFFLRLGAGESWGATVHEMKNVLKQIQMVLFSLFTEKRKDAGKALGGPIVIFSASYELAQMGLGNLLWLLAMISLNLSIINLLPIPILDGGSIMLLVIEKIKGSPLDLKYLQAAYMIGFAIIITLMAFAFTNDISNMLR